MSLVCVGSNWKTPVRIRERLAIDDSTLPQALGRLKERQPWLEFSILSTCNRTELYAGSQEGERGIDTGALCDFLADFRQIPLTELAKHLYRYEDGSAILHLLSVASGLDSLILGEGQILGQVKQSYEASVRHQAAGPILQLLFQNALRVAKRVQTETQLSRGKISIGSAAVDYIRGVFENFGNKTVLIIGAGKIAELTLTHLKELGPEKLIVCNRNPERACELAGKFGGSHRPFEELHQALVEADVVISSTGAEEPIMRAEEFRGVIQDRQERLIAILDIAVPRDFDVAIGKLDNVLLWNIDDLEKVSHRTLRSRERELGQALQIVDAEARQLQAYLDQQKNSPVIGMLEQEYQRIMEVELDWLWRQLNGPPEEEKDKIRHFAHRLKNKFLHPPKAALNSEVRSSRRYGLLDAFRKIFGLEGEDSHGRR